MRVSIETYRNFEIFFDIESESFYTVSNEYDREEKKRSYAACKKWIDDYIKENENFTSFLVYRTRYGHVLSEPKLITGRRKDGRFVFDDGQQLSEYYERDYYLYNEANDAIQAQIAEKEKQIDSINQEIKELAEKQILVSVQEYKKQL